MPVFVKDGRAVLFVHVPKAGGTSIERLFRRSGWEMHGRATRRSDPETFELLRCSPQHYHAALLADLFRVDRFDLRFLITRDPVARFRSEYLMRHVVEPQTDAAQVRSWWLWARARYAENPFLHDNHLRPQVEFELPGTEIYRLEDGLESVVAALNDRHDLGLDAERIPHTSHSRNRAARSSADVEVSPLLASELADFYRADYERFGYPLPT